MSRIPQSFLFRLRIPCRPLSPTLVSSYPIPETLDASYGVPFWSQAASPNGFATQALVQTLRNAQNQTRFDFRIGWAQEGLLFTVVVANKREQRHWTHSSLKEADCVLLCLDARDLKDLHHGSRYCHKLLFYPLVGEGANVAKPLAQWLLLERAKARPEEVDVGSFRLASERRADGYAFSAFIPGSTLTGYDPKVIDRIGFHFIVQDSEYGKFALQHTEPFPVENDPSLWATLTFEK